MNRDDIIRMMRESHLDVYGLGKDREKFLSVVDRFANLVANHVLVQPCCGNFEKCQRLCMPRAAAAEREACAKVAERFEPIEKQNYVEYASAAIRARREQ